MGDLQGDIVAFPDDDCWYPQTMLEDVARFFEANPHIDCLCTCVFDPASQKTYGKRPMDYEVTVDFSNLFKLPCSVGMFVRRDALLKGGAYFDERLGAGTEIGSGEEIELISRLLNSGANIRYVGTLHVFHPVANYIERDVNKYYRYGFGFGYLNGRLVADGQLKVIYFLLEIAARSAAGVLACLFNSLKRRLYAGRLRGITGGFIRGYRGG